MKKIEKIDLSEGLVGVESGQNLGNNPGSQYVNVTFLVEKINEIIDSKKKEDK